MYIIPMHLSEYMRLANLKDAEVAEAIGTSRPTVSRIRRRKNKPDWATIEAIAAYTNGAVTANDFVGDAE